MTGLTLETIRTPVYRNLLLFNLATGLLPSAGIAFFFFMTDTLHLTAIQFNLIAAAGELVRIFALLFYDRFLRQKGIRLLYIITQLLESIASIIPLGLISGFYKKIGVSPWVFVLSDDVLSEGLEEVKNRPLQIITSILVTRNVEATTYQVSLSAMNLSWILNGPISAMFMSAFGVDHQQWDNLLALAATCATIQCIIPLVLAWVLLPTGTNSDVAEQFQAEKKARKNGNVVVPVPPKRNYDQRRMGSEVQ